MIKVNRIEEPKILIEKANLWKQDYLKACENYKQDNSKKGEKEKAEKKYNHKEVKDSLKKMFNHKCAFCESHITHIDYGQIEHFKPKSKYPELCFDWHNLLMSCTICNSKAFKGDKFPLRNENGPLINPVEEQPNNFFKFEYDIDSRTFLVIPKNKRALTSIKILGLNRDELILLRTRRLSQLLELLTKALDKNPNNEHVLNDFIDLFSEKDEFYAFIVNILNNIKSKFWK